MKRQNDGLLWNRCLGSGTESDSLLQYCFIEGSEMKEKLSGYLSVLFEQNVKSVGGTLPDDDFYYKR